MKKLVFGIFVTLFAFNVEAAKIKLDMQLYLDGKFVQSTNRVVNSGETVVVEQRENENVTSVLEVQAEPNEFHPKEVFQVDVKIKKNIFGKEHFIGNPRVIARSGDAAVIEVKNEQNQGFRLRVIATPAD
ncbi:MAG: hypothetical protein R2827_13490 [Bdellovibrionales bacterium]